MAHRQDAAEAVGQALAQVEEPTDRKVLAQARRTRAVSLALAGLTYQQIADDLHISLTGARELVARTLEETRNHAVDELRDLENARLDRAQAAIWSEVIGGDLKAINTYLRISERRAKMNGLDAPTKVQMAVSVRQEMERALADLEEVILDAEVVEDSQDVAEIEERMATTHAYPIDPMVEDEDDGYDGLLEAAQ